MGGAASVDTGPKPMSGSNPHLPDSSWSEWYLTFAAFLLPAAGSSWGMQQKHQQENATPSSQNPDKKDNGDVPGAQPGFSKVDTPTVPLIVK